MAVEILTVSLSDESIEALASAVANKLMLKQATYGPVTHSNPPSAQTPQPADGPGFQQQADPWTNSAPQQPGQQFGPPPGPTTSGAVTAYPQQPAQQPQQGAAPTCQHGPMRYVPAGFSQNTGRAYPAFWGCQAQRGDPTKCKSVPA